VSRTDATRLRGRSRHNKVVNFSGVAEPGELVEVEIASASSQTLVGLQSLVTGDTGAAHRTFVQ